MLSMVDNHTDTVNAIKRFVYANASEGAERDIARFEERTGDYLNLEFRRECGSVTLYIEIDSFAGASTVDERGDRYRTCFLKVRPSWPSYGSVELDQASGFLALLSEVTTFAKALAATFDKPIVKLVETAEQIVERKQKANEENARARVRRLMQANSKGLRVGQERRVEAEGEDFLPIGRVEVSSPEGRQYTTNVTSTRAFYLMRTA